MSWEGYERVLCKNGHLHIFDSYDSWDYPSTETWKCPICGEKAVWTDIIDQTNCCTYNGKDIDTCACCKPEGMSEEDFKKEIDECNGQGMGYFKLKIKSNPKCKCDKCGHEHNLGEPTYEIPNDKGRLI